MIYGIGCLVIGLAAGLVFAKRSLLAMWVMYALTTMAWAVVCSQKGL